MSVVSANSVAYTSALKQSVVDAFNSSAVKTENILNFQVAGAALSLSSVTATVRSRGLQSASSISLTYEVKTTAPTTFSALSTVLTRSISSGKFNKALSANAVKFGAPGLANAEAGPVAVTDLNPSPGPASASTLSLQTKDVIGIVVALVGSCLVCCYCIYRRRKRAARGGSSSGSTGFGRAPPLSSYGNSSSTGYGFEDDHDSFSNINRSPGGFIRDDVPAKTNYAASFNINGNRGKRLGQSGGRSFNDGL